MDALDNVQITRKVIADRMPKRVGCDVCFQLFHKYYTLGHLLTPEQIESWNALVERHDRESHPRQGQHVGNGRYSGPFAFTLTKSPKDALSVGDMLIAVRKIMRQTSCPVVKYAWYYEEKGRDEHGEPIHPHIHGMYETATGGRIERKHWSRAWKIWDESKPLDGGFRGGYHRPVRNGEGYSNYIKKDGGMHEMQGFELTE